MCSHFFYLHKNIMPSVLVSPMNSPCVSYIEIVFYPLCCCDRSVTGYKNDLSKFFSGHQAELPCQWDRGRDVCWENPARAWESCWRAVLLEQHWWDLGACSHFQCELIYSSAGVFILRETRSSRMIHRCPEAEMNIVRRCRSKLL